MYVTLRECFLQFFVLRFVCFSSFPFLVPVCKWPLEVAFESKMVKKRIRCKILRFPSLRTRDGGVDVCVWEEGILHPLSFFIPFWQKGHSFRIPKSTSFYMLSWPARIMIGSRKKKSWHDTAISCFWSKHIDKGYTLHLPVHWMVRCFCLWLYYWIIGNVSIPGEFLIYESDICM